MTSRNPHDQVATHRLPHPPYPHPRENGDPDVSSAAGFALRARWLLVDADAVD